MLKKIMLLAAAVAAFAAFAAPAAQAEWTMEGSPLEENANLTLTGPAGFTLGSGPTGAHAHVHATLELTAGTSTAHVTTFDVTNCTGTGNLAGLSCTATVSTPWTAHTISSTNTIRITNIEINNTYYSPLDPGHTSPVAATKLIGNALAEVDNTGAITSASLSGEGLTANGNAAQATGTLSAVGGDSGTYGFK